MAPATPTTASKHQNDASGAFMTHDAPPAVPAPIDTASKDKPRWGKWTKEEEAYTARLIADFTAGLLNDVDNGTTMRSWLSAKLRCCPMRISKKFVGEHSIGKRMFERNDSMIAEMTDGDKMQRATELDALHADFCESWAREERERLEHQTNGTRKRKRNKQPKKPKPSVAPATATTTMATKRPVSPLAFKQPPRAIAAPIQTLPKSMAMPQHHTQPHKRQPTATAMAAKNKLVHRTAQAPVKPVPSLSRSSVQPASLIMPSAATAATTCTLVDLQQSLAARSRNLSVDLTGGDLFAKTSSGGELDFSEFAMDVSGRGDAGHPFDLMDTTDGASWMTEPLDHELDEDPFVSFDAAAALMLPPQVQVQFADLVQVKADECGDLVDLALSPTSVMDMDGDAAWPSFAIDYDAFFAHQY